MAPDDLGVRGHGRSKSFIYRNSKDEAPDDLGARGHAIFRRSKDEAPDDLGVRGLGRSRSYIYKNSKDVAPEDPGAGGGSGGSFFDTFTEVASGSGGIPTVNTMYYRLIGDSGTEGAPGVANSPGQLPGSVASPTGGTFTSFFDVFTDISNYGDGSVPVVVTDPLGNTVTNHYDGCDNLVSTSVRGTNGVSGNVALGAATFQYDSLNRLTNRTTTILNASGTATGSAINTAAYADCSQVTAVTDANGNATAFTYDTVSRLRSVTNPKGHSITDGYDANGNIITETNRLKSDLGNADLVSTKSFVYDALNRCTTCTDGSGNVISYFYDSRGNVVQLTDPRSIATQFQYDDLGRQTAEGRDQNGDGNAFGAADIITLQGFDDNSRRISQTDPNTNTTRYAYDALNRRTAITNADLTVDMVVYDVHGNLVFYTDPNGSTTTSSYDLDDRLAATTITSGAGVATSITFNQFSYDGLGRKVQAMNDGATTAFTHDSLGRQLTETQNGLTVGYTYDAAGNLVTEAYPGGRTYGFTYDAGNRCRRVALLATSDGDTLGMMETNHFLGDLPERHGFRNGTYTLLSYDGSTGTPNAAGDFGWCKISRIQHLNTNGTVIDDLLYAYDAAQNKIRKTTTYSGATNAVTFRYDNSDRLTNTVVTNNTVLVRNTVYFLDKAGNRQFVSGDNHPGVYTMSGADFKRNQYTVSPVGNFFYDLDGNRIYSVTNGMTEDNYVLDYDDHTAGIFAYAGGGTTSLTVSNFSFEANSFGILPGAFLYQLPNGWTVYDPSNIVNQVTNAVGVMRPTPGSQTFFLGGTTQGTNAMLVYLTINKTNVVAGLQQTLTTNLQADTTYTLSVDVGNPGPGNSAAGSSGGSPVFYNFAGFPGYRIELLAGSTVIAVDSNSIAATIPEGQFRTATLNVNSSAFPGLIGQQLTIRLVNLKKAAGLEVEFDNVRLTATTSPVATPLASYTYDAMGRRIEKIDYSGGTTNLTDYFYDGLDVIEERNDVGTVIASYPNWPDCEDPNGDNIVAFARIKGTNYWGHTDDQASMVAVTLDNGTVAERYAYQDYGEPSFYNGSGTPISGSAVGTTYLYTGLKYDTESKFYNADRDLDPRTGSWLQLDTIGVWGDPGTRGNGHNYVGSNPATFTDAPGPSGALISCHTGVKASGHSNVDLTRNSR